MKRLRGQNASLTGASGGSGGLIGEALAQEGVNLFLVAYLGDGPPALAEMLSRRTRRAVAMELNPRDPTHRSPVVERAREERGAVDILLNHARVEFSARLDQLPEKKIPKVIGVNLAGPMMLTHTLLAEMLQRGCGRFVNISSLAGKSRPAFQAPYAATKAALNAFTCSLRASYGRAVSQHRLFAPTLLKPASSRGSKHAPSPPGTHAATGLPADVKRSGSDAVAGETAQIRHK